MKHLLKLFTVSLLTYFSISCVYATTAGIPGPIVNEGHASFNYRIAYDSNSEAFAQRAHYQQSLNDDIMARVLLQVRETESSDFDFNSIDAELFWQLTPAGKDWQQGLRFDVRVRDDDRPSSFGINWLNQFPVSEKWTARALLNASVDFGDNTRDGIFLQTRGQIIRPLEGGHGFGFEIYSAYGSTDDLAGLSDQNHQLGPILTTPLSENWSLFTGVLFGLTESSPDTAARLWLTRNF